MIDTVGRASAGGPCPPPSSPAGPWPSLPDILSADRMDALLRKGEPPIVGRIHEDRLLIDMRCVNEAEIAPLAEALRVLADSSP